MQGREPTLRIGIIDLGTNSVRFDVHQIEPGDGQTRLLHREKLMIRLGQGVFLSQKLDPEAIQRTLQAFISFRQTAKIFQTEKIIAFGTSALREASDADALLHLLRKKTSIEIRVISGEEEAQLIASGILSHLTTLKGHLGLVDIGGGSTEISICLKKKILHSASFPLGAARLQQVFLKKSPPLTKEKGQTNPILALRGHVKGILLARSIAEDWPQVPYLIGSSGTIRAIHRILKKMTHNEKINRRSLSRLIKSIKNMSPSELLLVPGMEAKRVDIILAGALLLEECMTALGAKDVLTTEFALRDGILDREIRALSKEKSTKKSKVNCKDFHFRGKKLGYDESHARHVEKLAGVIFERTQQLHGLDSSWKVYLLAAAILHDVGKSISPIDHERHSYYIVLNSDFLGMQKWESEFIAQLCLHHPTGNLTKIDLDFTKNRNHSHTFVRLLAILRVADALDRGNSGRVSILRIRIKNQAVTIKIDAKTSVDLELLRLEQKKSLFEEVFQRSLLIELP